MGGPAHLSCRCLAGHPGHHFGNGRDNRCAHHRHPDHGNNTGDPCRDNPGDSCSHNSSANHRRSEQHSDADEHSRSLCNADGNTHYARSKYVEPSILFLMKGLVLRGQALFCRLT